MNSENCKTSDSRRLLLNLTNKINLQRSDEYITLSNLSIYYTWEKMKKSYKNNKLKISAPTWNEKFELIETMKLLGKTKTKITKDEDGEIVPRLEITQVVLIHCNIVNNDYQQDLRVFYIFVLNRSFGLLLDISPENFLKNFYLRIFIY